MKKTLLFATLSYIIFSSTLLHAENDNQILLKSFHDYGITKCDKLIIENSGLGKNWNFFITKHSEPIDSSVYEASVIQIYGSKDDTVKTDVSYIQSKSGCFVTDRSITTFAGSCKENVDLNLWYVSQAMPDKDYTEYKNKGGTQMQAKEITVGNFKACIKEVIRRDFIKFESR